MDGVWAGGMVDETVHLNYEWTWSVGTLGSDRYLRQGVGGMGFFLFFFINFFPDSTSFPTINFGFPPDYRENYFYFTDDDSKGKTSTLITFNVAFYRMRSHDYEVNASCIALVCVYHKNEYWMVGKNSITHHAETGQLMILFCLVWSLYFLWSLNKKVKISKGTFP